MIFANLKNRNSRAVTQKQELKEQEAGVFINKLNEKSLTKPFRRGSNCGSFPCQLESEFSNIENFYFLTEAKKTAEASRIKETSAV
ncbi:hypothetical protein [Paenibacillus senegalensis]|uniref:hypothetical protein n=1 Tax=Paenibacillus senegalensis TaxID=1465766 RepID=UPI0002881F29|nr:hypothetical protein [Paenibacillus senegalensis]